MISNLSKTLDKMERKIVGKCMEKGIDKCKIEVAKKLLKMGLTVEQV